ncbi:hypothetical protein [Salinivibrio sp. KP-1]|uniref:hypothetical protein n=1 Tax=Salinivibrio sp. KP-1 TaxID=1406902 RepID=UPI000614522A|nr:hypothetical protein [Salinivibrio sp. KP-1]KKA43745.1 hypothetical protein WN56_15570 [Salinivibrio sp. KP-1]
MNEKELPAALPEGSNRNKIEWLARELAYAKRKPAMNLLRNPSFLNWIPRNVQKPKKSKFSWSKFHNEYDTGAYDFYGMGGFLFQEAKDSWLQLRWELSESWTMFTNSYDYELGYAGSGLMFINGWMQWHQAVQAPQIDSENFADDETYGFRVKFNAKGKGAVRLIAASTFENVTSGGGMMFMAGVGNQYSEWVDIENNNDEPKEYEAKLGTSIKSADGRYIVTVEFKSSDKSLSVEPIRADFVKTKYSVGRDGQYIPDFGGLNIIDKPLEFIRVNPVFTAVPVEYNYTKQQVKARIMNGYFGGDEEAQGMGWEYQACDLPITYDFTSQVTFNMPSFKLKDGTKRRPVLGVGLVGYESGYVYFDYSKALFLDETGKKVADAKDVVAMRATSIFVTNWPMVTDRIAHRPQVETEIGEPWEAEACHNPNSV